jgi:phage shock protein E
MRHVSLLLLLLALLAACGAEAPAVGGRVVAQVEQISATDLQNRLADAAPPFVLDVRNPDEYTQEGHIGGAALIPLPELEQRLGELPRGRPIVCVCGSGKRSSRACTLLADQGFTQLSNMQGGMDAWKQAGYPLQ